MRSVWISAMIGVGLGGVVWCADASGEPAQNPAPGAAAGAPGSAATVRAPEAPDFAKQPTLYTVGYAHLDTEWRWAYPQTIREFVPNTLHNNFPLFEKYPHYVFNFSGSRRYQFMQEYYPEDYAKLKAYVAAGRWFPCGSSVDENDANVPSAESVIRHVLYGNRFFRREFGVASEEYMLPDCFGFPAALPSILAHCGIRGFSTQKLTWGLAVPLPFKVGVWEGPDGQGVVAALDPGSYVGEVLEDLSASDGWKTRIDKNGAASGVFVDYHYYGTGDQGGAPTERSVAMVEQSVAGKGPVKVISSQADWMFKAITPEMRERLPRYKGELLLTEHSAGSITSEAYMKRWNRKNELLADAAERAASAAWWLGGEYPQERLEKAWTLVLGSQMHDILPGTSLPKAYEYAWNDEVLAANQFATVLEDSVTSVASLMDTRGAGGTGGAAEGTPVVVYNPLSFIREDIVEAEVQVESGGAPPASVRVTTSDGARVPAQVSGVENGHAKVVFLAKTPAIGFGVFNVKLSPDELPPSGELRVDAHKLENARYVVTIDDNGDVSSVRDKAASRELLSGPARLGMHYEKPRQWPAWNQDWTDRQLPPKAFVGGPAKIRVVERGPARVAVEIERECEGSTFVQRIRLAAGGGQAGAGAGDRIEFETRIDWASRERSLRAAFPFTVHNPDATYDIQVGTIKRSTSHSKLYEHPSHQWIDLTDRLGDYGVTVMKDSKYGSDKPDDSTLRLTLLYTPGVRNEYQDQGSQDLGRHEMLYAISGHRGDMLSEQTDLQALRLNQPLRAFVTTAHEGSLGGRFSLMSVDGAVVSAVKKAEESDELIVRCRGRGSEAVNACTLDTGGVAVKVREVDGQERPIGPADLNEGKVSFSRKGCGLQALAVKRETPAKTAIAARVQQSVALQFDADVISSDTNRSNGAMEADGATFPAEQLPAEIVSRGVKFKLGSTKDGDKNALVCRGQEVTLPGKTFERLHVLAAASGGDQSGSWRLGQRWQVVTVQDWRGYIGQWDHRLWIGEQPETAYAWPCVLGGLEPGYIKPSPVAWFATHHHAKDGNAFYQYCYLFHYTMNLQPGAAAVVLPKNPNIRVFAMTATSGESPRTAPASPLFDMLAGRSQDSVRIEPASGKFDDATEVRILPRLYWSEGGIRYTLDGTVPTATSPAYLGPIALSKTTDICAACVDKSGKVGPVTRGYIEIQDVTPPKIERVSAVFESPLMEVSFSEPLEKSSAGDTGHYVIEPAVPVTRAVLSPDGRMVTLLLDHAPEADKAYRLKVNGVTDVSPAHNAIRDGEVEFRVNGPVFRLGEVAREKFGEEIRVEGLPVRGSDPWTINCFVRVQKQPENRTLIAGFGACKGAKDGTGRYLAKFTGGAHVWSHNSDCRSEAPLDIGRWQMLTAAFDGTTLRLYKDGLQVGERSVTLSDDEPVVRIAPVDPWEQKLRFDGEIRDFTVWKAALGRDSLPALLKGKPGQ